MTVMHAQTLRRHKKIWAITRGSAKNHVLVWARGFLKTRAKILKRKHWVVVKAIKMKMNVQVGQ